MLRVVLIAGALLVLAGCATVPESSGMSACQADGRTLRVSGQTDERMLGCLRSAGEFDRLEITSEGGSVRNAIDIGRSISARRAEVVVVDYCESSCANYLIPAASRVRVRPGARIVLHGSVDGWALARGAAPELYQLQRDYAADMGIPPGWLLMRTSADGASGRHGAFLTGDVESAERGGEARYIIVEPSFMASCLPALPTAWETPTYADGVAASEVRMRRLERQGFAFSGTMRCRDGQSYPPSP